MSIAPVVHTVEVRTDPARTFELFTGRMGEWWVGKTNAPTPLVDVVIEPHIDGLWFERDAEGRETRWGKVLAWDPPSRLLLGWQLDSSFHFDPDVLTEVELRFTALPTGGTSVRLEHRDLERYGADAPRVGGMIGQGWPKQLGGFSSFADARETVDG